MIKPPWWFCCGWWSPWCVLDNVWHRLRGGGELSGNDWICRKHDRAVTPTPDESAEANGQ